MGLSQPVMSTRVALLVALATVALATAREQQPAVTSLPGDFWFESLSASQLAAAADDGTETHFTESSDTPSDSQIPAVFRNGAWTPDHSTNLNTYVAALLSKDVYFKHVIDPRDGAAARRNFTLFAQLFCRATVRLGADDCEVIAGADALVWAVIRAGPSVLLVVRGSNSPQNWITDVTSFRTTNVDDFGGGPRGTNVALGFYKVFSANRRLIVDRVHDAMGNAAAAAAGGAAPSATNIRTQAGNRNDARAANDGNPGPRLWVFGHSLGGAVALMAASYLDVQEGLTATGVYTFGCPRVGDELWAHSYRLYDVTLRLENTGDIIPTLPFGNSWRHVGSSAAIQACKTLQPPQLPQQVTAAWAATAAWAKMSMVRAEKVAAAATVVALGEVGQRQRRRLRGDGTADEAAVAAALYGGTAAEADLAFPFPFPVSFRDHWVQTYVQVLWSCLPDSDQDLVPGPEDVYGRIDDV